MLTAGIRTAATAMLSTVFLIVPVAAMADETEIVVDGKSAEVSVEQSEKAKPAMTTPQEGSGLSNPRASSSPVCIPAPAGGCLDYLRPLTTPAAPDPTVVARQAVLELTVPDPGLVIAPDPFSNEWKMMPVGLPLWAGNSAPATSFVKTTTQQGITITMAAAPTSTTVDWGDGTVITCTSMTIRRPGLDPHAESPDCGHIYEQPADYTVTATTQWVVTWTAAGQTGQIPLTSSSSAPMPIGEIVSVLVPPR